MQEFSVELQDGMGNNTGIRTFWSTDLSICGSLSLWFFFFSHPSSQNRGGSWCQGVFLHYQRDHMCASHLCPHLSCPLAWEAIPQLLSVLVCAERRAGKVTLPSASWEYFVSPGVSNLGSFQSRIEAVQVSQPFVLRARCLTYFQAGMLGHTGIHHICKHSSELRKAIVL